MRTPPWPAMDRFRDKARLRAKVKVKARVKRKAKVRAKGKGREKALPIRKETDGRATGTAAGALMAHAEAQPAMDNSRVSQSGTGRPFSNRNLKNIRKSTARWSSNI